MQILVTGATGVVGRRVVPLLVARGHRVKALGRSHDDAATAALAGLGLKAGTYNVVDDEPVTRREYFDTLAGGPRRAAPEVSAAVDGALARQHGRPPVARAADLQPEATYGIALDAEISERARGLALRGSGYREARTSRGLTGLG